VIVNGLFAALDRAWEEAEEQRRQLALFRERDRLAAALHDGICQSLFFANVKLKEAEEALAADQGEEARRSVHEARTAVKEAHDDVRQAVFNLKMASPLEEGLRDFLATYLEEFQLQTGIRVRVEGSPEEWNLERRAEGELLSILKEALWNVRKHARAREVRISFSRHGSFWELSVADDGKGFSPQERREGSLGLRIMEERARTMGGEVTVNSQPGRGTRVTVRIPRREEVRRIGAGIGG
jgi:two-component system nitrate/nitrite sensor histidine kinase NarX